MNSVMPKFTLEDQANSPLSLSEVVELAAVDSEFMCHTFFPNTARQTSPPFHKKIWQMAESNHRMVNIQVFRDGAKTSILRMYMGKRIAYGLARTILVIGKSEGHAIRTINWIKTQVTHNRLFAETFKLSKGAKWQDTEAQIKNNADGSTIWILGMGITGSIRGINRDDFRPDLILIDDVLDDENCATDEQREKLSNLIYGAVKRSLAPASESPDAKMVMTQTPLHKKDASTLALNDAEWVSAVFGCWTDDTKDLPVNDQLSAWDERYPSATLRKEKKAALERNKASVWYREMECKLVAPETSAFKTPWLKHYDILPVRGARVMVVDPVPPPSQREIDMGLVKKDYEAITVVQRTANDYYLCAYETRRGHDPSWSIATMFTMAQKWRPRKIMIESVAYQRTLAWLMKRAMEDQSIWYVIDEFTDMRDKYTKIVDSLNGLASAGHLWVLGEHSEFIEQFNDYPNVDHDDVLETVAIGVAELMKPGHAIDGDGMFIDDFMNEDAIPDLRNAWGAP